MIVFMHMCIRKKIYNQNLTSVRDDFSEHMGILTFLFAAVEGFCLPVLPHGPEDHGGEQKLRCVGRQK